MRKYWMNEPIQTKFAHINIQTRTHKNIKHTHTYKYYINTLCIKLTALCTFYKDTHHHHQPQSPINIYMRCSGA